ncbi:MAG: hypothetical protein ACOCVC_03990 [Spirochaeta sp.]
MKPEHTAIAGLAGPQQPGPRRSLLSLLRLLPLLHSGRLLWRLWLWLPAGAVFSAGVYMGIDRLLAAAAPPFPVLFLLSPAYAVIVWWVTDNIRSQMLTRHTVAVWLLLPLTQQQKNSLLLARSTILPFGGLWLGALLSGIVWFPEHLELLLRYTPYSLGIALCLGVTGWNGCWVALDTKVFGQHISYRSNRRVSLVTLLLLVALPVGVHFGFAGIPALGVVPIICAAVALHSMRIELYGTASASQVTYMQRRESSAPNQQSAHGRRASPALYQPPRRVEMLHRLAGKTGARAILYGWELLNYTQYLGDGIREKPGSLRRFLGSGFVLIIISLLPILWLAVYADLFTTDPAALGVLSVFAIYMMYAIKNSSPSPLRTLPLGPVRIGLLHAVRTLLHPLPVLLGIVPVASGLLWLLQFAVAHFTAGPPPVAWPQILLAAGSGALEAIPVVLTIAGCIYILLNLTGMLMQGLRRWTAAHVLLNHPELPMLMIVMYMSFHSGAADDSGVPLFEAILPAVPLPAVLLTAAAVVGLFCLRERFFQGVRS